MGNTKAPRNETIRDNLIDSDWESFRPRNYRNIMRPKACMSMLEDRHIEEGT